MVNGWEEVDLLSLSDGGMQNGVFYEVSRKGSGIPLINVGDMYTQVPITSDGLELFDATDDEVMRFAVNDGDLFFTRSSVVPSGIAFCNWYKQTDNKPVVFDSHVIRFKTDKNKVVPMFLYLQCISPKARRFFIANAKTATMTTIDQTIMGKCPIDLPPLPEQRRIAAALSDTDALIAALEKLIAKKRSIKQGAMQELLTGKRRLPGFSGEWKIKRLGDGVLKVGHGQSQHRIEKMGGKYPILATSGEIGRTDFFLYDKPSVLIGRKGTIDKPQYMDTPFWTIDTLFYTIVNDGYSVKYLFYVFCTIEWGKYNEASGVPSLSAKVVEDIEVNLPPPLPEQTAIAAVLTDMDAEIDALTAKLAKLKHIKQGMMSELLTGRIRLAEQEMEVAPVAKIIELPKQESVTEKPHHSYSEGYEDAVILVALVNLFGKEEYPFTAFDCQKFPYLFHRHLEGVVKGYKKFPGGPYNPSLKFRTARPIALSKNYIRECVSKYKGFVISENAQEALGYFTKWYGDEPLKWLEQFRKIPGRKNELELLTTTDKAIVELRNMGKPITLQAVKDIIKKSPAWKDKLKRPIFSDKNIIRAINWSNNLFGKEETNNGKN